MSFFPAYRRPLAWMLFAFILFNGLACSLGHGMLMAAGDKAPGAGHAAGMADMPGMKHHAPPAMDMTGDTERADAHPGGSDMSVTMKLFGDCTFAGILTLALIFFVALGWLLRARAQRPAVRSDAFTPLPRFSLPRLNPQAP